MIIIWNHNEIAGRKCASVTVDHKRLHITERFGKIEGWIDGVRIGIPDQLYFDRLDKDVRSSVEQAIARLGQLGAAISPVSIDLLPDASRAASIILFAEAAASLEKWHRTCPEEIRDEPVRIDLMRRERHQHVAPP